MTCHARYIPILHPYQVAFEWQVSNVTIDPAKTALLIVDLQNFAQSKALRNNLPQEMFQAEQVCIIEFMAFPRSKKVGIQVFFG